MPKFSRDLNKVMMYQFIEGLGFSVFRNQKIES